MILPIEIVPDSRPLKFRWKYVVDTPNGKTVVAQEGSLNPSIEVALQRLISIAKQALLENASLHGQIKALTCQLETADQSTPPVTTAQKPTPALAGNRKGK
jgi:hypothetical protein